MKWLTKSFKFSIFFGIPAFVAKHVNAEPVSFIVGGQEVQPGEYPYLVHLGNCGGTLIAPDIVLTAAHCNEYTNKQVIIGAYARSSLAGGAQERFCDRWITDPYWDGNTLHGYDFALCKLNEPVDIDESSVRLKLNDFTRVPSSGENLIVIGLGRLSYGGVRPSIMRDLAMPYISTSNCNQRHLLDGIIKDTMMCAGYLEGGKGQCVGDSGSPLIRRIRRSDGTFVDTLVGVISWSFKTNDRVSDKTCALSKRPGVSARVSSRIGWIKNTMCNTLGSIASFCNNNRLDRVETRCDGHEFVAVVATDVAGYEDSWSLSDSRGNQVMERKYLVKYHENVHKLCLKSKESYRWVLNDSGKNGMCSHKCGYYDLSLNGKLIAKGPGNDFTDRKVIRFDTPATPPTPEPTARPSPRPTPRPTQMPSRNPTGKPTNTPKSVRRTIRRRMKHTKKGKKAKQKNTKKDKKTNKSGTTSPGRFLQKDIAIEPPGYYLLLEDVP